ncbi:MAG: GDP-mannose 4,6-dehydratase [Methanomicrobiales archaeon]
MMTEWNDRRVLITGAGGFAGPYLARFLLDQGALVHGLVRKPINDDLRPDTAGSIGASGMIQVVGDLGNPGSLEHAIETADPEVVFHLAAQSSVAKSFTDPLGTMQTNCIGTNNLLEAVRNGDGDPVVVFAGSSDEYGLVVSSSQQYEQLKKHYGIIFPEPKIPEVPISETNPLRPMSPYAVSKVFGDHLTRNYFHSYGVKTVVSRTFNHEGAGRGVMFVTAVIARQVARLVAGETGSLSIGNVNAFRDWSHIDDVIRGYCILAGKGAYGDVYNLGTMRTTSVFSYLLMSLEAAGFQVQQVETSNGGKVITDPTKNDTTSMFGIPFRKTKLDRMLLSGEVEYLLEDGGITIRTAKGTIPVVFDPAKFRPAEVPILLADTRKIEKIGFGASCTVEDIIRDQLAFFSDPAYRE